MNEATISALLFIPLEAYTFEFILAHLKCFEEWGLVAGPVGVLQGPCPLVTAPSSLALGRERGEAP